MFDKLMLIGQGKILYHNEAAKASQYFERIGYQVPHMSNPADYFMTVLSPENAIDDDDLSENRTVKTEEQIMADYTKKINYLHGRYKDSDLKNNYAYRSEEVQEIEQGEITRSHTGFWFQLQLLTERSFKNFYRLPENLLMRIVCILQGAIATDIIFQEMKGNIEGVQNRSGLLFFECTACTFFGIMAIILLFPEEKPVFKREVNNKMYSVGSYFFGKLLAELPCSIVMPGMFLVIVYPYVGLSMVHSWTLPLHCKSLPNPVSRPHPSAPLHHRASLHHHHLRHLLRQENRRLPRPNVGNPVLASVRVLRVEGDMVPAADLRNLFLQVRVSSDVPERIRRPASRVHGDP